MAVKDKNFRENESGVSLDEITLFFYITGNHLSENTIDVLHRILIQKSGNL